MNLILCRQKTFSQSFYPLKIFTKSIFYALIASKDTRERAAYQTKLYNQAEAAKMFGIHYKPLQNWLSCHERGEEQIPKTRGHPKPALTDEQKQSIKKMVLENPSITIASVIEKLGTGSTAVIHRAFVALGFKYKKNATSQ